MTNFAAVLLRLAALALPLAALGWWLRIYPRRGLVWLAVVPALGTLALVVEPTATRAILVLDAALALVAAIDLCTLPRRRAFSLQRTTGRIASLAKPHPVAVVLANHSSQPRNIIFRDGLPYDLRPEPQEFHLVLGGSSRATLHYQLRPRRRVRSPSSRPSSSSAAALASGSGRSVSAPPPSMFTPISSS